jgi:hypothetical protein
MEKENLKTKDQEKISQNVVNQTQEVDNSLRTLTAKKKSSKIVSKIGQKNKKVTPKKLQPTGESTFVKIRDSLVPLRKSLLKKKLSVKEPKNHES